MFINGLKIFFGMPILATPFVQGFSITSGFIGLAGVWLILSGVQGLVNRYTPQETPETSSGQQDRP